MEEVKDWGFTNIWNKSLEEDEDREYVPRDYLWASQLGKLETDVYLSLQGTKPTNPPNPRSLRKFEAGNLWEWIVKIILLRAGILHSEQERVEHQYEGLMKVTGKIDFIAGGNPNYETAGELLSQMELPPRTVKSVNAILDYLKENYPDGIGKKALEVKSCSSFVMNSLEITKKPLLVHGLQAYHYTKHPSLDRATIVYICRDDCRMMEFTVYDGQEIWEERYRNYIKNISNYYNKKEMPEKSPPIVFDEALGKFSINRQIGWSPYLELVYGFEDQMAFENKYSKIPASWNRVLKRMQTAKNREKWLESYGKKEEDILKEKAEGKKTATIQYILDNNGDKIYVPDSIKSGFSMTEKNQEAILEMAEYGWDADKCAEQLVDSPDDESDDTD